MAAFVGIVIIFIINNYLYLLPIQYIECDRMLSPLMTMFYGIWTYQTCYNQLSLFYAQEAAA
jgi:hypothetical protein